MAEKLLVTGAAGQLGQRVIAHLIETHRLEPAQIVAATRHPDKLSALAAAGVDVRRADFDEAASLSTAFAGVDRLLLISTDALDKPGRRLAQHKAAIEAARKAGVKQVVYTSMPNPESSVITFSADHLETERALAASGLGWAVLRNAWYMENLFMVLPAVLASGKWFASSGEGRIPYIIREDCARAAAGALVADRAVNARYDITGARGYTRAEVAGLVTQVSGKPIEVVQVSDEQLAQGLTAAGVPGAFVPMLVSFDTNTRLGHFDLVSEDVRKLTGRVPQGLPDFLEANRAALTGGEVAARAGH